MNVCFLHGGFSKAGGIERVVSILLNSLEADKTLKLFSLEYIKLTKENIYSINPAVVSAHLFNHSIPMSTAMIKRRLVGKVTKFLKDNNIDIIIGCGALYFPIAVIAAKLAGAKSVCWEHTNPKVVSDYKFQKQCRMFGLRHSDVNVVITANALNFYDKIRRNNNRLIYNPIDNELLKIEPTYDVESNKIISVGRLCYAKNYDLLIEVAEKVLPNHPSWSWDIYGGGGDFDRLNKKIKHSAVADKLLLKGSVSDIYKRYDDYSFIVMTSRYEGFPMVLLEAAARALPMISFDIETGPNEIIENGLNGYLIQNQNADEMADKIENIINNKSDREAMSKASYLLSKKFSLENIINQWKTLFEELIDD